MDRERLTVLIVEDQMVNRVILKGILQKEYDIVEAENGAEALTVLSTDKNISAILLDIVMPVMDGYAVLRELKDSQFASLPVIVMVVADRFCFGSIPGREQIEIRDGETAFDAICRTYLEVNECARFMSGSKIDQRHNTMERLVKEYSADGIIIENMKFCEFWSYEKVLGSYVMTNERNIPCCTIEKEYVVGSAGQLRTRFQAFVESLEIKKINS